LVNPNQSTGRPAHFLMRGLFYFWPAGTADCTG
jgi:hypothetical protein